MSYREVEFPSAALPLCLACQRLRRHPRAYLACAAFPEGIPRPFLDAKVDHRSPYPGDRGVRFEPDWGAPEVILEQLSRGR